MFGNSKKQVISSNNQVGTIIGKDTFFKGSINSQEVIRIDGNFEGDISTTSDLIIGESGQIKGQIKGQNITLAGIIEGNLTVVGKLELLDTAKLYGDSKMGSLIVSEGAVFQGSCFMQGEEPVKYNPNTLSTYNAAPETTEEEKTSY